MLLHVHVYLLLLFQLGGIGLLAYGSYIKNNNGLPILGILTIILEYVHLSFPWLLIMAAIICILVSFLGCCGAVKKFRGMLTMVRFNLVMKSYFANSLVLLIFCSGWGGGGLEWPNKKNNCFVAFPSFTGYVHWCHRKRSFGLPI